MTTPPEFELSLDSFDDLMETGIAVEFNGTPGEATIAPGCRVTLDVTALVWDGSSTTTTVYASGKLIFTVADPYSDDDSSLQVARGLNLAMLRLYEGAECTVIATPAMAYGDDGREGVVPVSSHIIYKVKVIKCGAPTSSSSGAIGPALLTDKVGSCVNSDRLSMRASATFMNKPPTVVFVGPVISADEKTPSKNISNTIFKSSSNAYNDDTAKEFSLKTLDSFDDLMETGIAVEFNGTPGEATIAPGCRVTLDVTALVWDGSSTTTTVYASGKLIFTVADPYSDDDSSLQVARGLNLAMLRLYEGAECTVIATPAMAYGDDGREGVVPVSSHIVYKVDVVSVNGSAATNSPAEGPYQLLHDGSPKVDSKASRRTVKAGGDDELSDDMVSKLAVSMSHT